MLAKTLLDQHEYPEALIEFETSLKLEPDSVTVLRRLSRLSRKLRFSPAFRPGDRMSWSTAIVDAYFF